MTTLTCTVNGARVAGDVEPRTHLADFVREQLLLTGTHLGCEQGVCGACTLLLDDAPVRSCLTFALLCKGRAVTTIEGLEDDPIMTALRAAFTANHGLQCGYCTPGMLVTARDIVLRLPDADDQTIRLELAGNLCRCTGYHGIVRAIRAVLDDPPVVTRVVSPPVPGTIFAAAEATAPPAAPHRPAAPGAVLQQVVHLALPPDVIWEAVQDPVLIASCVPGVQVTEAAADRLSGEMQVTLGPIRARFAGTAQIARDDATRSGTITGNGSDARSRTRLDAVARFAVTSADGGSEIRLDVTYALQGPLAQFSRGPIVRVLAQELSVAIGRNLEARLRGETIGAPPLSGVRFALRAFAAVLHRRLGRRKAP